jgi:hypothetical protein
MDNINIELLIVNMLYLLIVTQNGYRAMANNLIKIKIGIDLYRNTI